ncbi:MAG TPA: SEC-C metal-binding domain-containing protein [Chthoniobacterales bacterium]
MPAAAEHAAWLLYPEFGKSAIRDGARVQAAIDAIEAHAMALSFADIVPHREETEEHDQLASHLRLHSGIVRGSSYPQQVARRIDMLLRPFEGEFAARVGIGPGRAFDILKALGDVMEKSINSGRDEFVAAGSKHKQLIRKKRLTAEEERVLGELAARLSRIVDRMGGDWVPSRRDLEPYVPLISDGEWSSLRHIIGLTPESRSTLSALVEVQDRPLFFLDDEQAFFVHGVQAFDALFNVFDDVARSDPQLRDRYGERVASWMEQEIATFVGRLFPPESVFRNACFADPDNVGGETEADVIVLWGPFLVVIEAKGKKIRRDALRGSQQQLKRALGKNVQDAFYQANRVIKVLERDGVIRFKERVSGRTIEAKRETLRRVMPVSVTLQHLSGVATQLAVTQQLGLFKDNAYPWSVSIDDLDVITRFAGSPDVFLHYIERRTAHQTLDISLSGDELDMFGQYLDNRLHPTIYEQRPDIAEHSGPRMISFDGGEERFEEVYIAEWYGRPPRGEPVALQVPSQIQHVLQELRHRDDYGARWIAFALLGLSSPALAKLNAGIRDLRKAHVEGRYMPRVTAREGDVLVTVIIHGGLDEVIFRENAIFRTRIEKYVTRAPYAVTIGINQRDVEKPFELALWMEGPWEYDEVIEELVAKDRSEPKKMQMLKGRKKLGRNDPCPCGSGKKLKNCCIDRIKFI